MKRRFWLANGLAAAALVTGCPADDDGGDDTAGDTDDTGGHQEHLCFDGVAFPDAGAPQCADSLQYYRAGAEAATDEWPACMVDDGEYHLVDESPSSIARVQAYVDMMAILRTGTTPTAHDFTMARAVYSVDEGLESRLQRREDLRFPEIPMSDWDPGVESDKQCTVASNVQKHAGRCAGPATLAPMINDAFMQGQTGMGDPDILAARIDATVLWFLYISTFKEADTCFTAAAKDCDSSWAYFTGGQNRAGGLGLSGFIRPIDPAANEAIWNGFAAFRCLRELEPPDDDPSEGDLTPEGLDRLSTAREQLRAALAHGTAQALRDQTVAVGMTCGPDTAPQWEFIRTLAHVLTPTADAVNGGAWAPAKAIIENPTPTGDDLVAFVGALDAIFPCAQPPA